VTEGNENRAEHSNNSKHGWENKRQDENIYLKETKTDSTTSSTAGAKNENRCVYIYI